ncbi:MAG TPA: GNAT family N-acetyltransferase [Ignavibacteriales bacterium]|nr:GNAT family N-acetyltransferase [Ignavibacteriales bacterium]
MIRKLLPEDRDTIERMLRSVVQFNPQEVEVAMELVDVAILRPLQEDYLIYVYEEDGCVIGYHCTGRRPLTDGVFDLYWIVVDPATQSKGIGRQLLMHAEDIVSKNKGRWLLAETSSKESYTATRNFYMRNGYSVVAEIRDFYSLKDNLVIFGKYFQ